MISRSRSSSVVLPGATLGVLGGGQLGRMFAMAAKRMGYLVHVYSPDLDCPAKQVAERMTVAEYTDLKAVARFADQVDVVTFEFENVAAECAATAERVAPLRPAGSVLHTVQNREREKIFLGRSGFPCAPFVVVDSHAAVAAASEKIGFPAVLKRVDWGYDGSGQALLKTPQDIDCAWDVVGRQRAVLEAFVDYECEFSVIVARTSQHRLAFYGPIYNRHEDHILDVSVLGHPSLDKISKVARDIAAEISVALEVVGLICVEFFLTKAGDILINEIAPRPHNSGHLTIEACATSQFEQQVRTVCGLPLGSTDYIRPAAMANLLGDLWEVGEPCWQAALSYPNVALHLYGKKEARSRRKLGHLSAVAESAARAEELICDARRSLRREPAKALSE